MKTPESLGQLDSHFIKFVNCAISYLQAYSCADLYKKGVKTSGVYYVQIRGTTYWYLKVYCNMEVAEGGWTVRCLHIILTPKCFRISYYNMAEMTTSGF
jgi:hypothetical protein